MTRPSPVRIAAGLFLAVLMTSCGGAGVDTEADGSAATADGRAGGPTDTGGGARPGGPFDLEAFENIGGDYAGLQSSVDGTCEGGSLCHLGDPDIVAGHPDDVGGVDN
jgi:hypothetical protein